MTERPNLTSLQIEDRVYETQLTRKFERRRAYVPPDPGMVVCVIPGVIQKIHVSPGQVVSRDSPLLVIEAMKMQNDILSPIEGKVQKVHAQTGKMVAKGELLVEIG